MLNFTSYKKVYFHYAANVQLKPLTKVLKNLFHNIALKNLYLTTTLPSYFSRWQNLEVSIEIVL